MDRAYLKGSMTSNSQSVQYRVAIDVIPQSQGVWLASLLAALVVLTRVTKRQS